MFYRIANNSSSSSSSFAVRSMKLYVPIEYKPVNWFAIKRKLTYFFMMGNLTWNGLVINWRVNFDNLILNYYYFYNYEQDLLTIIFNLQMKYLLEWAPRFKKVLTPSWSSDCLSSEGGLIQKRMSHNQLAFGNIVFLVQNIKLYYIFFWSFFF